MNENRIEKWSENRFTLFGANTEVTVEDLKLRIYQMNYTCHAGSSLNKRKSNSKIWNQLLYEIVVPSVSLE